MINYAYEWKKKTKLIQYSYDDFVTDFPSESNVIYMEKVDGMLGMFIYDGNSGFFQTSWGGIINEIPLVDEYMKILQDLGIKEAKIPGELVAKKNKEILPFNETMSIVKTYHKPENKDLIYHYPLDVYSIDNKSLNFRQILPLIKNRFKSKHISNPKIAIGGIEKFRELYSEASSKEGFDGIVARDLKGKNYKIKFSNTVDLLVIGAGREKLPAWEKSQVSYLLTGFIDKNDLIRSSSKVGTGFTDQSRSSMYKFIIDNELYREGGEVFIKPLLVIEMKFFRFRFTDTPTYRFKNKKYEKIGYKQSITFSHPSFKRIRSDKKANIFDTRLEQIPDWRY